MTISIIHIKGKQMELPENFKLKMQNMLGNQYDAFIRSLDNPIEKAITVNTGRIDMETFAKIADFQYSPVPNIPNGYYVANLHYSKSLLSHMGIIYSQEPSAMYPVELLDVQPGDIVLDVCGAPGGKSTQIMEKLNGSGFLLSNEIEYSRTKILYENLNKLGYNNYAIINNSPIDIEKTELLFDKILVDAPCGGEGMFRRDNFDFNSYKNINIETNAKRQLSILNSVKNRLKKGGRLVYSTCTYDIHENEMVVAEFLTKNPDFHLIHIPGYENSLTHGIKLDNCDTEKCYRRYPHLFRGEGQFMAVLEKDGNDTTELTDFTNEKFKPVYRKNMDEINKLFKGVADISGLNIYNKNDVYFAVDNALHLDGLNVLNIGTIICSGKPMKIHHNFYHTFADRFYNIIDPDDNNAIKYIQGLEIDVDAPNSIVAVTTHHIPLGGGKVTGDKLKNYYPKELRVK